MTERFYKRILIGILVLFLVGGGVFAFYIINENKKISAYNHDINESEENNVVEDDCSEMNGWWKTGYHEFTITAPIVKSWNGSEGIIEKDPTGEQLYIITFKSERDGYVKSLIYYIIKGDDSSPTEFRLIDAQQGQGSFDLYKQNDD